MAVRFKIIEKTLKAQVLKQCCLPNVFHKKKHPKYEQQRALHVHQRKTKNFIANRYLQPFLLLHTFSILVLKSPRKANIKSCHYTTVVKGCLNDNLEVVASPEVACRFRYDPNHCEEQCKKVQNFK